MREVYVIRGGQLVPKRAAGPKRGAILVRDYDPYECPITGTPVDGRRQHRENLKRHNCRILETGESRDAIKAAERGAYPYGVNDFSFLDRD